MSHSSPPTGCPFHAAQNRATATDSPRPANGTPAAGVVPDPATVLAATCLWVEKAVVGLNLCPFANAVLKKGRLHIQVSEATEPLALLEDLRTELKRLLDAPETEIETSLLVCPRMLSDFLEFNDFLDMLHLLRETSIDRAVAAWGEDTDRIFENNIARLQALGPEGWRRLSRQWQAPGLESPDEKPPAVG